MEKVLQEKEGVEKHIKPCPFCGSLDIQIDKCTKRVRCRNCFATGGLIAKLATNPQSENAAMEAWNRRCKE